MAGKIEKKAGSFVQFKLNIDYGNICPTLNTSKITPRYDLQSTQHGSSIFHCTIVDKFILSGKP